MSIQFHVVLGLPRIGSTRLSAILKKIPCFSAALTSPGAALVISSSVLLFIASMLGTVVSAEPISAAAGAKPSAYDVGPDELASQLSEIAAIPEFQLTGTVIERISGVRLETDGPPSQGIVEPGSEQSHFGPGEGHPYELSWYKTGSFAQFGFVWHEFGKKYLPFERAPSGMCMQAKSLAESFVHAGWKLHYSARFFAMPPSDTYTRGEHGSLRLDFDSGSDCVIGVLLVATFSAWLALNGKECALYPGDYAGML